MSPVKDHYIHYKKAGDQSITSLQPRVCICKAALRNFNSPHSSPDIEEQKEDGDSLSVIGELPVEDNLPTIHVYSKGDSKEAVPISVRKPIGQQIL
eukprot:5474467-Ditylum_brightwellii.AAC.1